VSAPPQLPVEKLIQGLRALCAQPSSVGQLDDLRAAAELIAGMLHGLGMEVRVAGLPGPPVVIGRRAGRSERVLLLYHCFDAPPPGPWAAWSHEPYQLAERDGALYGRGVARGKGPLAAHIHALQALVHGGDELPCGVVVVADGGGLLGSPTLADAIAAHPDLLRAHAVLGSAGDRDAHGTPLCYSGSKGQLQVRLSVRGPAYPLPAGAAPAVRNPLWRLTWALASIKGDDEDIRIPGFYECVDGPTREENILLREVKLDERGRLGAWGAGEYLFGMGGVSLVRAEVSLPTCNLSAIHSEPDGDLPQLPAGAGAVVDFQLVPRQEPAEIARLLRAHLDERGFADVAMEVLPGGFPPVRTGPGDPFIRQIVQAAAAALGSVLPVVPAGTFALPLQPLAAAFDAPAASVGVARAGSAPHGPDEHIPLDDLARHGQLLIELLLTFAEG
jgi:acetylornithine deacetylase/succinyl-diaminopimelate desuccinylase-like protein